MNHCSLCRAVVVAALLLSFGASAGLAADSKGRVTIESLLREMADRDALARRPSPAYVLKQISSHDPAKRDPADATTWHSNHDYEQFLHTEVNEGRREWVIMDADGPGAITRFWLPLNPDKDNQVIRFYFDGSTKPAIAVKFNELLSGRAFAPPPFAFVAWNDTDVAHQKTAAPAVMRGVAGDLYLPIPFARHCKITLDELPFYYILDYRAYAPGTSVRTFDTEDLERARTMLERIGQELTETFAADSKIPMEASPLAPGEERVFDLPPGTHAVRDLHVRIDPKSGAQALRSIVLTAAFDDEPTLWCPIGDFFGTGARLHGVHDRFQSVSEDGVLRAQWIMPYHRSARFTLRNMGTTPVTVGLSAAAGSWRWDDRSFLFHANWHCALGMKTRPQFDWNYIDIDGEGLYAGDTLTVYSPVGEWYGEGDERIYIDEETFPSHIGTGTEDYYGYAWGMASYFSSPFLSAPARDLDDRNNWRGYTTTSRLRLLDAIPLTKHLRLDMEIWNWSDTQVDYAVACFWYARPGTKHNRIPQPVEAAAAVHEAPVPPEKFKIAGAIECEDLRIVAKSAGVETSIQNAGLQAGQWSGGKQLFVQAAKPGDFVELEIPVEDNEPRKVTLYGTKSFDYCILRAYLNGMPVGPAFDTYSAQPVASGGIDLGTATPKDGKLLLRVEVVGSNPSSRGKRTFFGLDCIILQKTPLL